MRRLLGKIFRRRSGHEIFGDGLVMNHRQIMAKFRTSDVRLDLAAVEETADRFGWERVSINGKTCYHIPHEVAAKPLEFFPKRVVESVRPDIEAGQTVLDGSNAMLKSVPEMSDETGLSYQTVYGRLAKVGWTSVRSSRRSTKDPMYKFVVPADWKEQILLAGKASTNPPKATPAPVEAIQQQAVLPLVPNAEKPVTRFEDRAKEIFAEIYYRYRMLEREVFIDIPDPRRRTATYDRIKMLGRELGYRRYEEERAKRQVA